ncbi:MAG: hypothetical protein ACTSVU_03130 [Promethearchaeota archaeon]
MQKNPIFHHNIIREKIIIYLDLTSTVLNKKDLIKGIESFIKAKLTRNPHQDFSIFYFDENNNPIFHDNLNSSKVIKKILQEAWKSRAISENYFENGLFYCLSNIAASFLENAITFRVLVISDLPSSKNSEYMDALMSLVETVRTFPTFIDIIRIGESRFYKDDVKLRVISTLTNGGLFYVSDENHFKKALMSLVKNKVLPDLRPEGGQAISEEHQQYYLDLAVPLEIPDEVVKSNLTCGLCENFICQYCNSVNDKLKVCPSCGYAMHECCSALYSWNYNIGLKNIFRCPNCGTIIKLDNTIVYQINGEDIPSESIKNIEEELHETQSEETWIPQEQTLEEQLKIEENVIKTTREAAPQNLTNIEKENEESTHSAENGPVVKRMGLFGPVYGKNTKKRESSKTTLEESSVINSQPQKAQAQDVETTIPKSIGKSIAERRRARATSTRRTMVCPVCSSYVKPGTKHCPKCGCPIHN